MRNSVSVPTRHILTGHLNLLPSLLQLPFGTHLLRSSRAPSIADTSVARVVPSIRASGTGNSAQILLVVQDNERNAFDQRALEWELLER